MLIVTTGGSCGFVGFSSVSFELFSRIGNFITGIEKVMVSSERIVLFAVVAYAEMYTVWEKVTSPLIESNIKPNEKVSPSLNPAEPFHKPRFRAYSVTESEVLR